jgi:hypothetical protein
VQLLGNEAPDRGFAGAHEADKRDINHPAVSVHSHEIAQGRGGRTPIIGDRRRRARGNAPRRNQDTTA